MKTREEIQSKKVGKNADVKAHLEATKGGNIDLPRGIPPVYLFYVLGTVVQAVGLNSVTSVVTYKNLIYSQTTQERLAPSLDVSGVSSTGSDGKAYSVSCRSYRTNYKIWRNRST